MCESCRIAAFIVNILTDKGAETRLMESEQLVSANKRTKRWQRKWNASSSLDHNYDNDKFS